VRFVQIDDGGVHYAVAGREKDGRIRLKPLAADAAALSKWKKHID
jgi:hypothetical protein